MEYLTPARELRQFDADAVDERAVVVWIAAGASVTIDSMPRTARSYATRARRSPMRRASGRRKRSRQRARDGKLAAGPREFPQIVAFRRQRRQQRYRGVARIVGKGLVRDGQRLGDLPFRQRTCVLVRLGILDRERFTLESLIVMRLPA